MGEVLSAVVNDMICGSVFVMMLLSSRADSMVALAKDGVAADAASVTAATSTVAVNAVASSSASLIAIALSTVFAVVAAAAVAAAAAVVVVASDADVSDDDNDDEEEADGDDNESDTPERYCCAFATSTTTSTELPTASVWVCTLPTSTTTIFAPSILFEVMTLPRLTGAADVSGPLATVVFLATPKTVVVPASASASAGASTKLGLPSITEASVVPCKLRLLSAASLAARSRWWG